jgi:hypothetical protein
MLILLVVAVVVVTVVDGGSSLSLPWFATFGLRCESKAVRGLFFTEIPDRA